MRYLIQCSFNTSLQNQCPIRLTDATHFDLTILGPSDPTPYQTPTIHADAWEPPAIPLPAEGAHVRLIYADASSGNNTNTGLSAATPVRTVEAAVAISRNIVVDFEASQVEVEATSKPTSRQRRPTRYIIISGSHYLAAPITLTAADSGLHFRNAPTGEAAVLTGATPLHHLVWEPYIRPSPTPPPPAPPPPHQTPSFV
jgi:hypothetical protein